MTNPKKLVLSLRNLGGQTRCRLAGSANQNRSAAVYPPVVRTPVGYPRCLHSSLLHSLLYSTNLNTNPTRSVEKFQYNLPKQFFREMSTIPSHLQCVVEIVSEVLISEKTDRPVWRRLELAALKIFIDKDSAETLVSVRRRNNPITIATFTVLDFISDYPSRKKYRTCELHVSDGSTTNLSLLIVYCPKQSSAEFQSVVQLVMDDIRKKMEFEEVERSEDSDSDRKKVLEERLALFGRVCSPFVYIQQGKQIIGA